MYAWFHASRGFGIKFIYNTPLAVRLDVRGGDRRQPRASCADGTDPGRETVRTSQLKGPLAFKIVIENLPATARYKNRSVGAYPPTATFIHTLKLARSMLYVAL